MIARVSDRSTAARPRELFLWWHRYVRCNCAWRRLGLSFQPTDVYPQRAKAEGCSRPFNKELGGEPMGIDGRTRIVILGGGFGGLYAALRLEKTLARDPKVEILLVNRDNFFLFTPMLHEVAASDLDLTHIVNPVRKLLKRVQFFAGNVEHIDLPGKRVVISHGSKHHSHEVEYDHLVIALGSITNFFNLSGLQE